MSELPPPSAPPASGAFPPPGTPPAGRRSNKPAVLVAGALALGVLVWFGVAAVRDDDRRPSLVAIDSVAPGASVAATPPLSGDVDGTPTVSVSTSIVAALPPAEPIPTTPAITVVTVAPSGVDEDAAERESEAAATTTAATTPVTSAAPTSTGSVATTAPAATPPPSSTTPREPSYPVQPDGTPIPIEVVFDDDVVTMTGTVPSEAAIERLEALAIANSKNPEAEIVTDLVIDPSVPINVGVRVIELDSPRFAAGSSALTPAHTDELDRVVALMSSLVNVNVLVIGHADQRGDPATNFELSEARALSVVSYLVEQGVEPERTSLRAVGEDQPLSLDDDQAALALNRRTEFVFTGLLVG